MESFESGDAKRLFLEHGGSETGSMQMATDLVHRLRTCRELNLSIVGETEGSQGRSKKLYRLTRSNQ